VCREYQEQRQAQDHEERKLVPAYDALTSSGNQFTTVSVGEQRYQLAVQQLDRFTLPRSTHQIQAHDAMLQICCSHIYGVDFLRCRPQLMKQFKIQAFSMATLMLFPRRFGKTTAVAMFLATLLAVCRGIKIVIVSPTQDVSNMLLSAARGFFYEIPDAEDRTVTNQAKCFSVAYMGEFANVSKQTQLATGRINSLSARAPTIQGNKGITADLIVMDEASRVDQSFINEVIAPLLTKNNTCMICISTALGANNWFSKLFTKNQGRHDDLFLRFRVDLVCDDCRKQKIKCVHKTHLMPPWLNPDNHDRAKLFMPNQDLFDQEVMGAIVDTNSEGVFTVDWLERWRQRPLIHLAFTLGETGMTHTVTFVDTYGGGANELAMVTVLAGGEHKHHQGSHSGGMIVLGVASYHSLRPDQDAASLQSYFTALARHPAQRYHTRNFVAIESNFGGNDSVNNYQRLIEQVCPVNFIDDTKTLGTRTTQSNKASAVTLVSSNLDENQLHFASDAIATDAKAEVVRERLLRQLARIRRQWKHGWSFSGKGSQKSGQVENDDIAIAFLLAMYWHRHLQLEGA
jgi:hypothetical protein